MARGMDGVSVFRLVADVRAELSNRWQTANMVVVQ